MSKLKKYTIISPYAKDTLVSVLGEKAVLDGYESYEFIVFRAIDVTGDQLVNWRRFWVAEKTSGMICHNVLPNHRSKESAIEAARLRIREQNSVDENSLDNAIKLMSEFKRRLERIKTK